MIYNYNTSMRLDKDCYLNEFVYIRNSRVFLYHIFLVSYTHQFTRMKLLLISLRKCARVALSEREKK